MDGLTVEPGHVNWLLTLHKREHDGERTTVALGPYTAFMLITALQLASRHPKMTGELAPLFAGTPGEQLLEAGWDPVNDV